MRFLLNGTKNAPAVVRKHACASKPLKSIQNPLQPAPLNNASQASHNAITSKAWGQQCSPNCGCILRFEANLSDPPSSLSISPIVVSASFHTKRVIGTRAAWNTYSNGSSTDNRTPEGNNDQNVARFKPLLTHENTSNNIASRPILTSCTCHTLHHLAQRIIEHIPGKSFDQLKNEIDAAAGVGGGGRSSIPFRYTVLKEAVSNIPKSALELSRNGARKGNPAEKQTVTQQMNNLEMQHGHCYDLVEESFLSMVNERMPRPRKDGINECYSPTMGGYFGMYSFSRRNRVSARRLRSIEDSMDDEEVERHSDDRNSDRIREVGDWRRMSPSSYFLFGDDNYRGGGNGRYSPMMIGGYVELTKLLGLQFKEAVNETFRMLMNVTGRDDTAEYSSDVQKNDVGEREKRISKAPLTYLQLLDMYGDHTDDRGYGDEQGTRQDDDEAWNDWLGYVDRTQFHDRTSTSG
ncbi:hypothetical protein ACHAXS_008437 [Conticribra weissflogii]